MSAKANGGDANDGSTDAENTDESQTTGTGRVHDWGVEENITRTISEAEEADDRAGLIWNKKNSHADEVRIVLSEYEYDEEVADELGKYAGLFIPATETSAEATDGEADVPQRVLETDIRGDARSEMIEFIRDLSPEALGYDGRADRDDEEADDDGGSGFPREAIESKLKQRVKKDKEQDDLYYDFAQEMDIEGRTDMTKEELIEAVLDAKEQEFESDEA